MNQSKIELPVLLCSLVFDNKVTMISQGEPPMWRFSNSDMIDFMGKMELIKFAMEQWALPAQHYGVSRNNKYKDERLYTFANMAYAGIREVGCHFEQCNDGYGFVKDAVFVCVYGAEVPTNALLYEKGTEPGCTASDCSLIENSTCLGLLCDAPHDPTSML
ncbi:unnamed protein product [Heligmosomoides polygyrus]|uniref:SCP domain-containing protein n=1 Tax=Heligmosomoides polygyrus TaxID=6339 RepID=A0A183FXF9_HELPZ|nr:unnamed protein product [Heligmosomoides polygyrus]